MEKDKRRFDKKSTDDAKKVFEELFDVPGIALDLRYGRAIRIALALLEIYEEGKLGDEKDKEV